MTLRQLRPHIRDADLVVVEQARRNLDLYGLALRRAVGHRRRIAMWGHGRDFVKKSTRVERWLLNLITRQSDWLFAYTASGADAAVGAGYPRDRITVLNNTIDTSDLRAEIAAAGCNGVQAGQADSTVAFVGGLDEDKRIGDLLEMAQILGREHDGFELLVIGDGPRRDEVLRAEARYKSVRYLGPLRGAALALALRDAQLLTVPGRVGLVAIDSFALEKPIVTLASSQHAPEFEYLSSGLNAIVVEKDRDYAETVTSVLRDRRLLWKLREGCRKSSEIYSIDAMAHAFVVGLQGALAEGHL